MRPERTGPRRMRVGALAALVLLLPLAALPLLSPPASALTEYRYEVIVAPPTPLDYKGVSWALDGSQAVVVGGLQAVLTYEPSSRTAVAAEANWSTSPQTLEAASHGPSGEVHIAGGRLEDNAIHGDLWRLDGGNVDMEATVDGRFLVGVAASTQGRVLAIGGLGTVFELVGDSLEVVGSVGDVLLHDIAWDPDGSGAFIVGAGGTVAWYDADAGEVVDVAFTSTHVLYSVAWRTGTEVAWAVGEGGLVVELNSTTLATSRVRPYTPRGLNLHGVSWHMDGDKALVVGEEGTTLLYRMGLFSVQVVDVKEDLLDVAWSPTEDEAIVVGASGTLLRYAPRMPTQNRAPEAVISSPSQGQSFELGEVVTFDGTQSSDPDGDDLTFRWVSNATGELGRGDVVEAELPLGAHTVTLTVDDGQGHNSTDSVAISVVTPVPPEQRLHITIQSPTAGSLLEGRATLSGTASYERGEVALVQVSVDDGPWTPAEGTDVWTMELDTSAFADGIHTIAARASTADGVEKVVEVRCEFRNVVDPQPPPVPNVTLNLRKTGMVDELLSFEVDGEDLTGWKVVWSFGDGTLGTGELVRHAYRDEGTYQVTLELWLDDLEDPVAVLSATVVIKDPKEVGPDLEGLLVLAMVVGVVIYVAGFYGGRMARDRMR